MAVHSPAELRDLIVHLLAGATGKPEKHWRKVVGDVEGLPLAFNIKCNWRVTPKGSAADLGAVEAALDIVRKAHPYVV
jgi:hypothetical protein